ncbi:hypothetical protein ACFYWU_05540 [Streptomyces chrestomyceticus]|uniref:hypothetical protein n=1 Tax=Streptomyces chrestomyceticus TaxID=68185 RepID=UPI0036C20AD3
MGWFSRTTDDSPEGQKLTAAREALANDPVNRGDLGTVDIDSPEAQANLAAQDRLRGAEQAYRNRRG